MHAPTRPPRVRPARISFSGAGLFYVRAAVLEDPWRRHHCILALPWYARGDPDILPATYDAWLTRANGVERQFQCAGFGVARSGFALSPSRLGARSGTSPPIK
jgi:hypothetical protein